MAERNPRSAADAFLAELRQALARITDAHVGGFAIDETRVRYAASFPQPVPIVVGNGFGLAFHHEFETISVGTSRHAWEASTIGYAYRVYNSDRQVVVAYHWHPEGNSHITWPHLHVYGAAQGIALNRVHLPTGDVGPADIIRCLIDDLGAGRGR